MLDLYAELRRIVEAFEGGAIPYAIVGGVAVSIHTAPRATEDLDLLVARGDLARALTALELLGFRPAGRPMDIAGGRLQIQRAVKIEGTDARSWPCVPAHGPDGGRGRRSPGLGPSGPTRDADGRHDDASEGRGASHVRHAAPPPGNAG
jgi:hypothetical protein